MAYHKFCCYFITFCEFCYRWKLQEIAWMKNIFILCIKWFPTIKNHQKLLHHKSNKIIFNISNFLHLASSVCILLDSKLLSVRNFKVISPPNPQMPPPRTPFPKPSRYYFTRSHMPTPSDLPTLDCHVIYCNILFRNGLFLKNVVVFLQTWSHPLSIYKT